jgi:hypothetical protein
MVDINLILFGMFEQTDIVIILPFMVMVIAMWPDDCLDMLFIIAVRLTDII